MLELVRRLFDTEGFPPRWECGWGWTAALGWTHIIADVLIWASYTAIPILLAIFITRRKDAPFPRIFWLFIAFIFFCGTTHLIEAIIFWEPIYRLAGVMKAGTAAVSIATACALVPALPRAMSLRSPEELEHEVRLRTKNLQESRDQQRALMSELDHRVKNNITAIMSLAEQTMAATDGDFSAFREAFLGRLAALTRTHEALSASRWSGANIRQIAALTLEPYEISQHRSLTISGPEVHLSANAASSLCMTLHELATNSVKYGSLSAPEGTIHLTWTLEDDGVHLTWLERGGPAVSPPTREGFGTILLRGMLEHNLQGTVDLVYAPDGLECRMSIPSHNLAATSAPDQNPTEANSNSHEGVSR